MFYIIKSNTKSIKDKLISNVAKSKSILPENIHIFDYDEKNHFDLAFFEYLSISFDQKNKLVILKNSDFLNLAKVEKEIEDKFANTINLANDNTIIFTVNKLNKTGKLNKLYSNKFILLQKDAPTKYELSKFISNFFKVRGINLESGSEKNIINKVGENFDLILTELKKLEIIQTDNFISNEIIEKAVVDFSRERLFRITEYVMTLNEKKVKSMMNQFRAEGEGIYLIGDFLIKEISRFTKYKLLKKENPEITDLEIQLSTGWNIWAIKNYGKWNHIWPDINKLENFLYEVIIDKCFVQMLQNSPIKPLDTLEKILVSNIKKIKYL